MHANPIYCSTCENTYKHIFNVIKIGPHCFEKICQCFILFPYHSCIIPSVIFETYNKTHFLLFWNSVQTIYFIMIKVSSKNVNKQTNIKDHQSFAMFCNISRQTDLYQLIKSAYGCLLQRERYEKLIYLNKSLSKSTTIKLYIHYFA